MKKWPTCPLRLNHFGSPLNRTAAPVVKGQQKGIFFRFSQHPVGGDRSFHVPRFDSGQIARELGVGDL
jgi:hypothetical protein